MLVEDAGTATASSGGDGEIELRAHRLSEDDAKIAALARNDVAGVRFAIRAVQQNKLIRNICPHQGLQRGAERRHVSNCAFELRICKDDLTGPHAPRNSAFVHGDDQLCIDRPELLRQTPRQNRDRAVFPMHLPARLIG